MRPADNINELIKKLHVKASADLDKRVHDEISRAQAEPKQTKSVLTEPNIWRTIMKTKTIRLAAAAIIVLATLVGVYYLGGSIDGASVAWSQVVEQLSNHERYKCRQRVVREQGPEIPPMQIYHLNLQQRRQELEDGTIHIIDMRGENAVTVELYPDQKKAVVTDIIGLGPRKDPDIIEMVKRFEQQSTERLGIKKVNGKTLQGFRHKANEYNDFTVWVDPATKLPVEIEIKHLNRGQTLYLDDFAFDFELDPSAFSTDVPDGYEVKRITNDHRPVESKQITAQDIRAELNHTAYTVGNLPWIKKLTIIQTVDPLTQMGKAYMTGILGEDGNHIIIDQSNAHSDYKEAMMEWILKEQLVMETPSGVKLYTHPRGSDYARLYLEGFVKADSEFFDMSSLSEERFARMIVMPDGTIMGLSANRQMSNERLQELVESLAEI